MTKTEWADPLPLLSLIISLVELDNENIKKKIYLPVINKTSIEQKRFLAFISEQNFLVEIEKHGINIFHPLEEIEGKYIKITDSYKEKINSFKIHLSYNDCTILPANIVDLNHSSISSIGIERYVDNMLHSIRHRIKNKITEQETYNRMTLFLKETLENILDHAYKTKTKKYAGFYIRYRVGLLNNSLDNVSRESLKKIVQQEHTTCPRLHKKFVHNVSGFLEIFVIDAGNGLTKNYFNSDKKNFREAWRETIGLGKRGGNSPIKNTEFGGLYTLSRLCLNNYLVARDFNEWIGDDLPIKGGNLEYAPNKSYDLIIERSKQIEGLALIGRISWKNSTDEGKNWRKYQSNNSIENPFLKTLKEPKDIYSKYYKRHFYLMENKPFYIIDDRFKFQNLELKKNYFSYRESCDFCLFLPQEGLSKNKIFNLIQDSFIKSKISKKVIIIADIPIWEASLFELALERASFSKFFLEKFNKIILITRRLSVNILNKKNDVFISDKDASENYIKSKHKEYSPDLSLVHYIELIRTHDSMLYWQHIKDLNNDGEYFLNEKVTWYKDQEETHLQGFLNFAKTLTDNYFKKLYNFSLERSLILSSLGCNYINSDILTKLISLKFNSLFYNKSNTKNHTKKLRVLLGSVYVTGQTELESEVNKTNTSKVKIYFFHNNNSDTDPKLIYKLFIWPSKGVNWINENLSPQNEDIYSNSYRRVGTSYVIAPYGWKYFPIPRYKLFNRKTKQFISDFDLNKINDSNYYFKSVYKSNPVETYSDWQGRKNQIISIGHNSYESNHDLFKINFPFIINESFLVGGKLAQFLVAEFLNSLGSDEKNLTHNDNDSILNGVKKYLKTEYLNKKLNENSIIVYPYHFNSDYIISVVKKYIDPILHDKIIALFPINEERSSSTFLISPITIESIKKKIEKMRTKNPSEQMNATIFDDATIGGKTRKEIKHILSSLGINNITTINILERRRLPFNTSDPDTTKSYWRLDIPRLGTKDICPICKVLTVFDNIKRNTTSEDVISRINDIKHLWKKKYPYHRSGEKIINPTNINFDENSKRLKNKFGIYFDGKEHKQCGGENNKIEIINSLGLSIYISELYSMTSRDNLIFQYTNNDKISDEVKIEILSTYLLLFGKELPSLICKKIIEILFKLCKDYELTNMSSYALVSLLSQGNDNLEFLYRTFKDEGEVDINIGNRDMQILCLILSLNPNSEFNKLKSLNRLRKGYENLKDLYKQFHSEIINDYGIKHDTPLQLILNESNHKLKNIRQAEDSCDKLHYLLEEIPSWNYRNDNSKFQNDNYIKTSIDMISSYKNESQKINANYEEISTLKQIANKLFKFLELIHNELFLCVGIGLDDEFPIKQKINELIEKSDLDIDFSENFKKIDLYTKDRMIERWIVWDKDVERKFSFLLKNIEHASKSINDPFNRTSVKKKAWLNIDYYEPENKLSLVIYNHSNKFAQEVKASTNKKIKREKLHLKELKISIDYEDYIVGNTKLKLLKTIITFPYL